MQFDDTLMLLNQDSFVEQTKFCYKQDQHNHCKNPENFKSVWITKLKISHFENYRFRRI